MDTNKKIRLNLGFAISLVVIIIPSFYWIIDFDFSGMSATLIAINILMRVGAFAGMAMFAWSLILSGRYKIFDTLFRGLDKVYVAHRFFGTASLALLLLHPIGYSLQTFYTQNSVNLFTHFFGYKDLAFTLGRLSLYGLLLIGIWSIFSKAKHETFIKIHKWLGVLYFIGATHAFMSGSVLSTNAFMFVYMYALSIIALITFLHYSALSDVLHPYYSYKVSGINQLPEDVWELKIKPKYRILNFKPGQFVYLSFDTLPEHGYHPFTIASGQRSAELTFYIKELGDLTEMFDRLRPEDRVRVKGPYGGFTFDDKRFEKQLWIAGGIGITPFLSKARSLKIAKRNQPIELIYAVSNKNHAFASEELDYIEHASSTTFNYTLVNENSFGRKSLKDYAEQFGKIEEFAIYLCGPPGMMDTFVKEAHELGIENQIHIEEFNF